MALKVEIVPFSIVMLHNEYLSFRTNFFPNKFTIQQARRQIQHLPATIYNFYLHTVRQKV